MLKASGAAPPFMVNETSMERQRVLLAVLKARGPSHPADLAWHPVIRDNYRIANRFEVEDDLKELVGACEVISYNDDVDGEPATVAYDIVDADRPNRNARLERGKKVVREHRRRAARRARRRSGR